jgi:[ribosomal protein S5]-alanine N-acetyltransferase
MMKIEQIKPEDTRVLRFKVLWPHKPDVESCVIDIDHRSDAIHLGACKDGEIVGVCSLFEMSTPKLSDVRQYRLRAMATDPDVRGSGAGRMLVEEALRIVKSGGYNVLWCDARAVALGFYEKLGFSVIDEWYEVPIIGPHKLMYFRFSEKG